MARKPRSEFDDDKIDPLKGSNRPTDFLKANFRILGPGGSFQTVKVKFPPKVIHAAAKKAGLVVRLEDRGPWLKVTIVSRIPPGAIVKKPAFYTGAGKMYSEKSN